MKRAVALLTVVAMAVGAMTERFIAAGQDGGAQGRGAIAARELAMSVADGFTITSVGDVILAYPQARNPDPGFQAVLTILREADVTTGNYEGNIIDGRTFRGSGPGGFAGVPEVAADLKAMGWDLVARSNNHAGEYGYEGLLETNRHLDQAGVVFAGSGESYWAARAPRFYTSPRGRVGMVATASSFAANMVAEPGRGEWLGRGGQSALRTTRYFMVPAALWTSVTNLRQAFPSGLGFYAPTNDTADDVTILGQRFKTSSAVTAPHYTFDLHPQDLRDVLAMVREGKIKSDFMTVAIHAHHFRDAKGGDRGPKVPETDDLDTNPSVADYLPVFAKAAIDAGADTFPGSGMHVLRGIEIYQGKPIFYGLGEFFRQMDIVGLAGMGLGRGDETSPPIKYESVIAVSRFERGQLAEVRLHPVELTFDVRMAQRGVPRLASPEAGRRILTRLQTLSAPFGTTITIDGATGVIRLTAGC